MAQSLAQTSDATIIEIKIAIFRKIEINQYHNFWGASVTQFRYHITIEGPTIGAGHIMSFTPHAGPITLSFAASTEPLNVAHNISHNFTLRAIKK